MARQRKTVLVYVITITNATTQRSRIVDIAETEEIAISECQRRNRFYDYDSKKIVASYAAQKLNRGNNSHASNDLV